MESYKCGHPPFVWISLHAEALGSEGCGRDGERVGGGIGSKGNWDTAEFQTRGCSSELARQVTTACRLCLGLGAS